MCDCGLPNCEDCRVKRKQQFRGEQMLARVCVQCGKKLGCYIGSAKHNCEDCPSVRCILPDGLPVSHGICMPCIQSARRKLKREMGYELTGDLS